MHSQKYILDHDDGLGDFDREYDVTQLLPAPLIEKGTCHLKRLGLDKSIILHPDGEAYFSFHPLTKEDLSLLKKAVKDCPEEGMLLELSEGPVRLYPLMHEAEAVGFLGLGPSKPETRPVELLIFSILKEFMTMNQQVLMTMGLHGKVVEDTYQALERRNAMLEESEQKYRRLAETLEKEVEIKAEKIRKTQEMLLLQEKMASIGQLAAGVAHEINNPTGFISSNLNSLKEYGADFKLLFSKYRDLVKAIHDSHTGDCIPAQVQEKLDEVRKTEQDIDVDFLLDDILTLVDESMDGADRIKKIVQDLKDFAHPEKHAIQYSDLNRVMDSTLNIVRNELKYKTLVKREYGSMEEVPCYPQQIGQVFMNLLVNAVQAMESSGEIHIKTYMEEDFAVVEIRDTGSGIAPENISRIFDPFFTTKEVGQGTGLGLNVAYKIIARHHGSIKADSQPGEGTCFTIKIPKENPDMECEAGEEECQN
ncbi:His Kinase A (phospho-acceptor) domain-containing protein [Desulfatibacillum alkenivorans DSM 16219]|uniref:histidine kinase n=1 Tax=Desulfatibacillum alkenivorans DSM 16219 TaxID=1121393 RepID=A0A1M6JAM3_9BACT|nr:ATP-binding protein [Desulfatibacillum alkenivorans]SHJ43737.1 His Kinase A (phospho-acceptor) domain-containing protein [Desulfatibacillum alkenivorans DSM 16219]